MIAAGRITSWATTHVGARRTHNEDTMVDRPDLGLWAVADGAGGHDAGEVASGMIAETLEAIPPEVSPTELLSQVRSRIAAIHAALRAEAERRGPEVVIASTVVVLVVREDHFACLWAGNSRAYLLRDGALSADHARPQPGAGTGRQPARSARRTRSAIRTPTSSPARSARRWTMWRSTKCPTGCDRGTGSCCAATG